MTFTPAEIAFLSRQPRGHLSTIGPSGVPQVKPVGFTYNAATGTIDITGFNMGGSAKFRNVVANPQVAFVVDEVTAVGMDGAHFLEIRGMASTARVEPSDPHLAPEVIRIQPTRIVSFNVDPTAPGFQTRNAA